MLIMNKWKLNWANCGCVVILAAFAIGVIVAVGPTLLIIIGAILGHSIESGYPVESYEISDAAKFGNENLIRSYGADFTPQWSSDGRIITMGIRRGIKGATADGSELWDIPTPKPEHHTYGVAISPSLSSTGRVAYLIYPDINSDERAIETAAADGTNFENFSDIGAKVKKPVWSTDGSRLAFTTSIEVTRINSFGSEVDIHLNTITTAASDGSSVIQFPIVERWSSDRPVWSNDGQRLAYIASSITYDDNHEPVNRARIVNTRWDGTDEKIMLEHRSTLRPQLPFPPFEPTSLAWSPADDRIYFVYYELIDGEDAGYVPSIRSVRPDGSDEWIIATWWEGFRVKGLKLSPDRSQLLFTTYRSPKDSGVRLSDEEPEELYVMSADGSEAKKVFEPVDDFYRGRTAIYASWSPDGSRIAVHDLGGGGNVFTISPDGADARLVIGPGIQPGYGKPLQENE